RHGPRPALRRLAASAAVACALWAGAVGTAVATTGSAPGVIHAIGHTLDLDGDTHPGGPHQEDHHS
ncbi:UDP-N-acetylglucosamine--N-acetylglucosamine transferase, partial [Streptomyces sp. NPDC001833]